MKISIGKDDLLDHLKKFDLMKQTYCQQSEYVCITTDSNSITLFTTNGEISLSDTLNCFVEIPGTTTITCRKLLKLLEVLPSGVIDLMVIDEKLQVKTVTGEYCLYTTELDNISRTFTKETSLEMPSKVLLEGIKATFFCVDSDETAYSLAGINLQTTNSLNKFCSTNRHTLATYEVEGEKSNPDSNFLIVSKVCKLLQKLLSSEDSVIINIGEESYVDPKTERTVTYEAIKISFGETNISYSLAHVGMFPRYDQLIPRQFERKVLVERAALISAIENIEVIAEQKGNIIKININQENQEIKLSCECDDVGTSKVSLPAQVSGDNITCAFNIPYLLGGLKSFSSTEVALNINQALTPVVIEPLSVQKRKFLIMPVQIRE